jgi:ATP-dependent Lhr-like helicase
VLGLTGERLVNHYSFYTAFKTSEEYQIIAEGRTLGTLPIVNPLVENAHIIFAGKRWVVTAVDQEKKTIEVKPSKGGRPPQFDGGSFIVDDQVRKKMFEIYTSFERPAYLDQTAAVLFDEGKKYFADFNLGRTNIIRDDKDVLLFLWSGDIVASTIVVLLTAEGFRVSHEGVAIRVMDCEEKTLRKAIDRVIQKRDINSVELAVTVSNKQIEKHDYLLSEQLLSVSYSFKMFDLPKAVQVLADL